MKLPVCFLSKKNRTKSPVGAEAHVESPGYLRGKAWGLPRSSRLACATSWTVCEKLKQNQLKTHQQMEKWRLYHDYKNYPRNVSLPSNFHMCLRTKGVHGNCVKKQPLHRTGTETGRAASLLFSTSDLICMWLVGVSSPSVHLEKKNLWN